MVGVKGSTQTDAKPMHKHALNSTGAEDLTDSSDYTLTSFAVTVMTVIILREAVAAIVIPKMSNAVCTLKH